jgi:hypothetical protein
MGVTECIALALEEKCDDPVGTAMEAEALNVMEAS